jgi:hypothetical protein
MIKRAVNFMNTFRLARLVIVGLSGIACAQSSPLPTLNIRLRNICLSVADSKSGEIYVSRLEKLPVNAPETALHVTQTWSPGGSRSEAKIVDGNGTELYVSELIQSSKSCAVGPIDRFLFQKHEGSYTTNFCISPVSSTGNTVRISMQIKAPTDASSNLLISRVLAVASCYQPRGLNAEYDGFTIGREIVRSLP